MTPPCNASSQHLTGPLGELQGRAAEAIACYEHVASLQSESHDAHANLASAYKDAARQDVAISSYKRALQLRPDFPEAFANLVHSLQCVCEWRDRPQLFQRLEGEVRRDLAAGRLPPVQVDWSPPLACANLMPTYSWLADLHMTTPPPPPPLSMLVSDGFYHCFLLK